MYNPTVHHLCDTLYIHSPVSVLQSQFFISLVLKPQGMIYSLEDFIGFLYKMRGFGLEYISKVFLAPKF